MTVVNALLGAFQRLRAETSMEWLTVKGAPEVVLRRCTDAGDAEERVRALAAEGLRVLAVADRGVDGRPDDLDAAASGLTLRGLVGLSDTGGPRPAPRSSTSAPPASRAGRDRGPSGDRRGDRRPGRRARCGPGGDLRPAGPASDEAGGSGWSPTRRCSRGPHPEQKVLLVGALRRGGATLAMTGDGVNDAAAIRLADVGVGVAGADSPAARRSADVVITALDLTRLVDAVGEGRAMWSRVRDAVAVLVGGNASEVTFTVLGTALGGRAPLNTRQLLLVNLLTDMFPALAVAVAAPKGAPAEDGDGPLAEHPLQEVLRAGPHRGFTQEVRRAGPGPRGRHRRGRLRGVGDGPAHRPARAGRDDGPGRADQHPARSDRLGGPAQPARARHRRHLAGRPRRGGVAAGDQPVLRLHAAGPAGLARRARVGSRRYSRRRTHPKAAQIRVIRQLLPPTRDGAPMRAATTP